MPQCDRKTRLDTGANWCAGEGTWCAQCGTYPSGMEPCEAEVLKRAAMATKATKQNSGPKPAS